MIFHESDVHMSSVVRILTFMKAGCPVLANRSGKNNFHTLMTAFDVECTYTHHQIFKHLL